jgi:hypothetical protein
MKVAHPIHDAWMLWQKQEHIPRIMATGLFTEYKFYHLLEQDESDGVTYIIQYITANVEQYKKYLHEFAPLFRQQAALKWGAQVVAFRTMMEEV